MALETKVQPVGTGQGGAGTPAGANREIPVHIQGEARAGQADQIANRAARKGMERQHREDPTVFTK